MYSTQSAADCASRPGEYGMTLYSVKSVPRRGDGPAAGWPSAAEIAARQERTFSSTSRGTKK